METAAWSIRYQYLNEKGTVDIFTKRAVIDLGNDGKDPFGDLIGLEKSSQKEFEQRDLSDFSASSNQTAVDNEDTLSDITGIYPHFSFGLLCRSKDRRFFHAVKYGNAVAQQQMIRVLSSCFLVGDAFPALDNIVKASGRCDIVVHFRDWLEVAQHKVSGYLDFVPPRNK